MTKTLIKTAIVAAIPLLSACEGITANGQAPTVDGGLDGGPLADRVANIWVSPDGCQYWYIDDGIEGYMAPRLNIDGTPRCDAGTAVRTSMFTKDGTAIAMEPEPTR